MTIKNADMPAMPQDDAIWCQRIGECPTLATGLTKRETFCLHMGVAETGDAELDEIIRKGNRQKMAVQAMNGALASLTDDDSISPSDLVHCAVINADALLAELERAE